jgi:hypothetical protein
MMVAKKASYSSSTSADSADNYLHSGAAAEASFIFGKQLSESTKKQYKLKLDKALSRFGDKYPEMVDAGQLQYERLSAEHYAEFDELIQL